MNFHNQSDDNFLAISTNLLAIMQQIVEHHPHELRTLIQKAQRAHKKPVQQDKWHGEYTAQEQVIDFLNLMELLVYETQNEHEYDAQVARFLMPAIEHIDQATCDPETVESSVEHAATQKNKDPQANAQELLYKELLKRWKPTKKAGIN